MADELTETVGNVITELAESGWCGPGVLYRLAQDLQERVNILDRYARDQAEALVFERGGGKSIVDRGVEFSWRNPTQRHTLDAELFTVMHPPGDKPHLYEDKPKTALIRKALPPADYPNLYKTTDVKGGLSVRVLPQEVT